MNAADLAPTLATAGALTILIALAPLRPALARAVLAAFVLLLLLRYAWWRIDGVAQQLEIETLAGGWRALCCALEMLIIADTAILFLVLARRIDRSADADRHERRLRRLPPSALPAVDVFIPTYNEGLDVLQRSIVGALGIDYPNLVVWVLDDGKRDWLREYCAAKGARYVRRESNVHAKAGNINHALTLARGAYLAVFDADFVPHRNFVYRTLGFFDDPRVAIVQTPQHFFNKDPVQLNLGLDQVWPDDQRFFFHEIMPCRDAWGAAFCCGSCALLRRAALDAIGGVPTASVTEDVLASLALLRQGYRTIYLDEQLSLGLAPESIESFFIQRRRWCRGNLQLLFLREGPLRAGLSLRQRLFFLPSYWLLHPVQLLFPVIPVVYLWTGLSPLPAGSSDALARYQLPALLASFVALIWCSRRNWVPILSTAVNLFLASRLAPTVIACLVRPFGVPFKVTPKGRALRDLSADHHTVAIGVLLLLATLGGVAINTSFEHRIIDDDRSLFAMAAFWSLLNAAVLFLLVLIATERPRRRGEERFALDESAACTLSDQRLPCTVLDVSAGGAKLRFADAIELQQGAGVRLALRGIDGLAGRVVWTARGNAGVRFETLGAAAAEDLQELLDDAAASGARSQDRPRRVDLGIAALCNVDEVELPCRVANASVSGALITAGGAQPAPGARIALELAGVGRLAAVVVRQVGHDGFGVRFDGMTEAVKDRLIRRLYTEGIDYPQHLNIHLGAVLRAVFARAFG